MILLEKCPVCESVNFAAKITCNDHTASKENFNIVSCETCGFTLTNPRPIDEKLGGYYNPDLYISHTNNSSGLFNWLYQNVRAHAIQTKVSLLKSLKRGGAHLDVGCGTGEFLNACKNSGFNTNGIEPSLLARKQAIENYNLLVSENTDLSQYANSKFDSISMWHVLEHVPNLNKTISHFNRILKPDGKLIIAVPNHNCWDANYYKEYWAAWDVPIHLWHFSKNTIERLFKNHQFNLVKTKPMIFDSYYISLLSEKFMSGKRNFIKGFVIGFISNLFGIFTKKGHSSIIYVFEKKN
jgi:2-polyprenyl-3-methyl-5-hydroxy-6-metoxy-1,4-benzoquinol methylase